MDLNPIIPSLKVEELRNRLEHLSPVKLLYLEDAEDGNVTNFELSIIALFARAASRDGVVRRAFEIGTFNGRTAANIAVNMAHDGILYTLDLPKEKIGQTALPIQDMNNPIFQGANESLYMGRESRYYQRIGESERAKVVQLLMDSADIDPAKFPDMDFIFVDGSHSYQYAKSDTEKALKMLGKGRPHGAILWHDYVAWPGVTLALNELYTGLPAGYDLYHIQDTTLVTMLNAPGQ